MQHEMIYSTLGQLVNSNIIIVNEKTTLVKVLKTMQHERVYNSIPHVLWWMTMSQNSR